jgi:hypothetical protein
VRFSQSPKQDDEIVSIDEGREIDRNDEHIANPDSPRIASREPGSNLKSESALQQMKQHLPIISTDDGMQTD